MIIHQPEIYKDKGHVILWTKIETAKKKEFVPDVLWYRMPEKYAPYLNTQNDVFLVNTILAAMYYEEDIEVRGIVSPKLAYSLEEYQFLLNFRKPDIVKKVSIKYENLQEANVNPAGVGSTFTGGIDSMHTIWSHIPKNQPNSNFQITHGIFINGFDILPKEAENYERLFKKFSDVGSNIGIDIIELQTNSRSMIHKKMNVSYFYGPLIVCAGLSLPGLFKKFYIPSSWDYYTLQHTAHASDPLVDRLLSTDTMDIIHHGSASRRIEKVEDISEWKEVQDSLWVCLEHKNKDETWNCSRCEKCVRTMIPLYALNVLKDFKTFKKPITKDWEILWYARKFNFQSNYVSEMFLFLKNKKTTLVFWLILATLLGYLRYGIVKFLPKPIKVWMGRFGKFIDRREAFDSYEVQEIGDLLNN